MVLFNKIILHSRPSLKREMDANAALTVGIQSLSDQ